ncbi:hypothetical protein [Spiroplasma endosymbiont of Agriotes lineatus]|uniref:sodium:calcium antiporter n=1 Tax=Spiroplasma endosymbiont of Agriotes lineatus TaxID=3077930 RepID=UPI0030D371B5
MFFVIFASVNFFASVRMIKYLSALKIRTKMSAAVAGVLLLSIITSLPELVSAITAGALGSPEVSMGDVMGANLFSGAMLAVADIIFIRYLFFKKINNSNRFIIYLMIGINIILVLALMPIKTFYFMRLTIPHINVSWPFLVLLLVYIGFLIIMFKGFHDEEKELKTKKDVGLKKISLKVIIIFFVISVIGLVLSSIVLVAVIDNFDNVYGVKKESAGAIFLGMTTALPEVVSLFSLTRIGYGNVAIAGIIGSHLFNSIIYFVADIVNHPVGSLEHLANGNMMNLISLFVIAILLLLTIIIFTVKTISRWSSDKIFTGITSGIIVILYGFNIVFQILQSQYHFL